MIEQLRRLYMTAAEIAECLGMAPSTVSAVLRRIELGKRSRLAPIEPANRYERKRPGELVHIDIKKLGRIRGAGYRMISVRQSQNDRRARRARGELGWEFVHVAVDDATRLAYAEVLPNEQAPTAAGFLARAVAWFASLGITVERTLSDNGACYRSHTHAATCAPGCVRDHWRIVAIWISWLCMDRLTRVEAKERTRVRLVEAAWRVFVREGYHQATLAEIAEAAGYTTGAVFGSFDGKADLFLAVLDWWLELRLYEVAGWLDVPEPERMASTVREWFAKLEAEGGWLVVLLEFRLAAARVPELNAAYKLRNDRFLDATVAVIQATRAGLGLERAPAARELAVAASALGYGLTLERLADPQGISTEQASRAEVLLGEAYGRWFAREATTR